MKADPKSAIKGYCIARGYRSLTIWFFSRMTLSLIGTIRYKPGPKLSRRQRYNLFCKHLLEYKIETPAYRKLKAKR